MPGSFLENVGFTDPSSPDSFGSWLSDAANSAWNGYQDLLDATSFGIHGKVTGAVKDFFGNVGDYINNALTGERDLERQLDAERRALNMEKELTEFKNDINVANYNRQLADSRKAVQYYSEDLERAGFNPALAASRGGSTTIPAIGSANSSSGISTKGVPFGNPAALSQVLKVAQSAVNVAGMFLTKL